MTGPITAEERDWAKGCLAAGDTLEEVAEWSGRPVDEWKRALGRLVPLAARFRSELELNDAGLSLAEIGKRVGAQRGAVHMHFRRLRDSGLPVPSRAADRASEGRAA